MATHCNEFIPRLEPTDREQQNLWKGLVTIQGYCGSKYHLIVILEWRKVTANGLKPITKVTEKPSLPFPVVLLHCLIICQSFIPW